MQAHFLFLAHNLMILCEAELARVHGVRNAAELARCARRLEQEEQRLAKENVALPLLVRTLQRLTVRSVKFIRWLPGATLSPASPRTGHRRPAPPLCHFVDGILDTVVSLRPFSAQSRKFLKPSTTPKSWLRQKAMTS